MVIRITRNEDNGDATLYYTAQGVIYELTITNTSEHHYTAKVTPSLATQQARQQAREYVRRAITHHPAHGMQIKWNEHGTTAQVTVYSDENPRPTSKREKLHLYSIDARDERVQQLVKDNQRIGREDRDIKPIDRKSARKRLAADNY